MCSAASVWEMLWHHRAHVPPAGSDWPIASTTRFTSDSITLGSVCCSFWGFFCFHYSENWLCWRIINQCILWIRADIVYFLYFLTKICSVQIKVLGSGLCNYSNDWMNLLCGGGEIIFLFIQWWNEFLQLAKISNENAKYIASFFTNLYQLSYYHKTDIRQLGRFFHRWLKKMFFLLKI